MEIIKEEIKSVLIYVNSEFKVKEKINLDFIRKLIICLKYQQIFDIRLRDKQDKCYELIAFHIDDRYLNNLKSFKHFLKHYCGDNIDIRYLYYSWNISFYRSHGDYYSYSIIYNMSRPDTLIINGHIHKDIYDRIKKILEYDSIDKYIKSIENNGD